MCASRLHDACFPYRNHRGVCVRVDVRDRGADGEINEPNVAGKLGTEARSGQAEREGEREGERVW